ncbi:MAG: histidinol dehydrogenase [Vicinamibacterales bacterium]
MRIIESSNTRAVDALLNRRPARDREIDRRVSRIVQRVRRGGDKALLRFAKQLDGLSGPVEVTRTEMARAAALLEPRVWSAIRLSARHIARVASRQVPREWTISPARGIRITQRVVPLDRVGCYVPGGRYPLPSSLLMTAVPAAVAGVPEIIAACPRVDSVIMAAALAAGVTRLLRIGGAHAIAAFAYGTETIPRVDKIVGPGNAYVATAKAQVAADCAIDFFAGPSEIAIVSTAGRAAWVAADLIAQAEHDPDARAILFTPSRRLAKAVGIEIDRLMPHEGPAARALEANGGIVVTRSLDEALALCQRMAPEHVVCDTAAVAKRLTRAGTVFVGQHSAQVAGDYATGSNHVLPTSGAAAGRGGLSAADFVRVSTVQQVTKQGLKRIAPSIVALAEAEGLTAHADSVRERLRRRASGGGTPRAPRKDDRA